MTALSDVQSRTDSIHKLRTVVGAMRGIAAAHSQQARAALASYRSYADVISNGLGQALQLLDADPARFDQAPKGSCALVLFAAEHGFAGAFGARLVDIACEAGPARLFVVGSRGRALLEERGLQPAWAGPMASQVSGVAEAARKVADALYVRFVDRSVASAEMVYARSRVGANAEIVRRRLFPIEPATFPRAVDGVPALSNLEPRRLAEQLIGEHVFAELALAALESFASENAARLATMESARLNIDQKLEELSAQERLLRQEQITTEVQDVVAGAMVAEVGGRSVV